MDDTDLAGPFVFCIAFGAFLLLVSKKIYFVQGWIQSKFEGGAVGNGALKNFQNLS